MDYRNWAQTPDNFPGKYGTLFMKFIESRQVHRNVTDATVVWYCSSWKAFRECVAKATDERELRQQLWDGITAIGKRGTGPVTINTYIRCLQAFVNWLLELEYIERRIKLPSDYLVASATPNRLWLRSLAPRICSYSVDLRAVPRPRSV